jgi:phosphomethylpyrimidine synthase
MKITQEVREYAAKQGVDAEQAAAVGMAAMSAEFRAGGGEVYVHAPLPGSRAPATVNDKG